MKTYCGQREVSHPIPNENISETFQQLLHPETIWQWQSTRQMDRTHYMVVNIGQWSMPVRNAYGVMVILHYVSLPHSSAPSKTKYTQSR